MWAFRAPLNTTVYLTICVIVNVVLIHFPLGLVIEPVLELVHRLSVALPVKTICVAGISSAARIPVIPVMEKNGTSKNYLDGSLRSAL